MKGQAAAAAAGPEGWGWGGGNTKGGNENKQTRLLPGTDDQFVLPGVEGQLGVIHRALRFEPENPRLHFCHRQDRTRQQSANQKAAFMTAGLMNRLRSKNRQLSKTPGQFDLPSLLCSAFSFFFSISM